MYARDTFLLYINNLKPPCITNPLFNAVAIIYGYHSKRSGLLKCQ